MVTIYHSPNSRSLRVLWTLEEMGVKAEVKSLPFPPRRLQPDYLLQPGQWLPQHPQPIRFIRLQVLPWEHVSTLLLRRLP